VERNGLPVKKKKKKGLVIGVVAVVAVVAAASLFLFKEDAPVMAVSTQPLEKTTLRNTISATGTVESQTSSLVYAKLSGILENVNVEVGDRVQEGDILAKFDTESIEDQILQQQLSINDSAARSQQSIKLSEKQYQQLLEDFKNDKDAALLSAAKSVETAQYNLKEAQYAVDHFGEPKGTSDLQSDLELYTICLEDYEAAYDYCEKARKAVMDAKAAGLSEAEISGLEATYQAAKASLASKQTKYENAKIQYLDADHQYQLAVDALAQAKSAYDLAMEQYEITFQQKLQAIDSAADSVDTSVLNASQAVARAALEVLQKQLSDAVVSSPVTGTVTAVYAKEGATATGQLFEIEDTENLKISTTIKEYDFPNIRLGLPVEIKSDGTGDAVMTGKITKIAPTAVKNPSGSSVEFAIEVSVDRPHEGLLIGMKARCSIILDEAKDVYGVPYDAVMLDESGSYIFAAEPQEDGYAARRIDVEVGLESDFYVEISGEGLYDGMRVVMTPEGMTEGMPVPLDETAEVMPQDAAGQ